jgi:hypothetical protein
VGPCRGPPAVPDRAATPSATASAASRARKAPVGHTVSRRSATHPASRATAIPALAAPTVRRTASSPGAEPDAAAREPARASGMPAYTARTSVRASDVPAVPPKTPGTRAGASAATTPIAA